MDTEKFIETVKMYPILYDARHKDYKNVVKKAEVWEKVAREMNEKSDALRIKWKGLKDGYTKYKKNGSSPVGCKSYINWCWGPHLQFLDDFPKRRVFTSSCAIQDVDSSSLPPLVPLKSKQETETSSLKSFLPTFSSYVPTNAADEDFDKRAKEDDSIQHLFTSYAETFRKFSVKTRAMMKVKMAKLFADAELIDNDMGPIETSVCETISIDKVFSVRAENSDDIKDEVSPINLTKSPYDPSMESAQIADSGSSNSSRKVTRSLQHHEQTNHHDDEEASYSNHSENSRTSTPTKPGGNVENRNNLKRPADATAINDVIRKLRKISYDSNQFSNEFDLFCDSLAVQLKKMPIDRALICQEKLQNVMTQERLFQLSQTEQSKSYDYDQSQTASGSNPYQFIKNSPPPDIDDHPEFYSES